MNLYRIENILLKPMLVLARSYDVGAFILDNGFRNGFGNRPDADFEVVTWQPEWTREPAPIAKWLKERKRGIIWSVDRDTAWELSTPRSDPT